MRNQPLEKRRENYIFSSSITEVTIFFFLQLICLKLSIQIDSRSTDCAFLQVDSGYLSNIKFLRCPLPLNPFSLNSVSTMHLNKNLLLMPLAPHRGQKISSHRSNVLWGKEYRIQSQILVPVLSCVLGRYGDCSIGCLLSAY